MIWFIAFEIYEINHKWTKNFDVERVIIIDV